MWRNPSIQRRFVIACLILLPLFLGMLAIALDKIHQQSLQRAIKKNLELHLMTMVAEAEPQASDMVINGKRRYLVAMPEKLIDADLNAPESPLQGYILDTDGTVLWQSPSSVLKPVADALPPLPHHPGKAEFAGLSTPDSPVPLFLSYLTTLYTMDEQEIKWTFVVTENQAEFLDEVRRYRYSLLLALLLTGSVLSLALMLTIRWGLRPLQQMATDIQRLEKGEIDQMGGTYPAELTRLITNLNQLIRSESAQRERYRNTLGDLAHSLKTPLAVCRGLLSELQGNRPAVEQMEEQIDRMNQIVQYQLQRAASVQPALHRHSTPVRKNIERLCNALNKVYFDKQVQTGIHVPGTETVWIDERDFTEVAGNLLDNAFKYGESRVRVQSSVSQSPDNSPVWKLIVENDGAAVPESMKSVILERGARVDTAVAGQGIGLAVVIDILSNYGGALKVEDSDLGGACFVVQLPLNK